MEHCIGKKHMYIAFIVLVMCLLFSGGSACASAYPESSHPYENNSKLELSYTHPASADSLRITFSSDTEVEATYDYIYITDANDAKQTFTGTELAGKTITVSGNTFTIELTSDGSVNKYGFTITNITAVGSTVKTGACGKNGGNIAWQLNTETGLLTLTGSGEMADYDYDYEYVDYGPDEEYYTHPWDNYLTTVTEIQVGEGITSLGTYAFGGLSKVTSVSLPSTLVSIGDYAFEDVKITSITLPEGLTTIGKYAFTGTSLTSVNLPSTIAVLSGYSFPSSVTVNLHENTPHGTDGDITWNVIGEVLTIRGNGAIPDYRWVVPKEDPDYSTAPWFDYKGSIRTIIVSEGVTVLGENAFHGLSFTSVSLPRSLTTIRSGALVSYSLTQVTVPSSVTTVEGGAFYAGTSVTGLRAQGTQGDMTWKIVSGELIVSGSMPDFTYHTMTDRYDTNYPDTPWRSYFSSIKTITVEPGITHIGNNAFYDCYYAETVNIPESVTSIGVDAFERCNAVTEVCFGDYNTNVNKWALISFANINSNPMAYSGKAKLYIGGTEMTYFWPQGNVSAYAFYNCQNNFGCAASGGKIGKIGDYAFYNCKNLYEAGMPTDFYHVGNYAFYGCSSLDYTFRLFDSLSYIGDYAFYGCSSLKTVNTSSDSGAVITYMGERAFAYCTQLTNVVLGSIETVADAAFYGCTALTNVTFHDSTKNIGYSTFYGCTSLRNLQWPSGLENIYNNAFSGTALAVSEFPGTLKTIGSNAFYNCTGITSITLPASLESLDSYSFGNCTNLKNIVFEGSAPDFISSGSSYHFNKVTATVTYRPGDSWKGKLLNYGGSLTWKPLGGACGASATWQLTANGLLRIIGSGTVEAGEWSSYADEINEILITSNITLIEENAFAGLSNVNRIGFSGTCTQIGDNAFAGIAADVYWPESCTAMRAMCESFATPYEEGFGGTLNWRNPVCSVSDSSSYYSLQTYAHNLVEKPYADATCTENGNLHHWQCSSGNCRLCFEDADGSILKDAETFVIAATGHAYGEKFLWTEDASACQAEFTCESCGDVQTLDAAITSEEVKAPECLINGDTQYTAAVEFEEHTFSDTLLLSDIPSTGHTEATIAGFEPTCTEPGLTDYIFCEVCEDELQAREEIPALGHTESVTLEALDSTCTEEGHTAEISCSVCGEVITASESIDALGHTEYTSAEAVAPDCVNTGLTEEISCSVCGEVLTPVETVPSLGHTSETDAAVAPDCVNTGLTEGAHCSVCGEVITAQETVPSLGHTAETDAAVAPTDRETGLTEGSHCKVCSEVITAQETVPANFEWDGNTVIGYNAENPVVVIPSDADSLGEDAFKNNTFITSVTVPENVASIGTQTFYGCTALEDVYLPDNLDGIGARTFYKVTARVHANAGSATAIALSYNNIPFTTEEGYTLRYRVTPSSGTPTAVWFVAWHGEDEILVLPATIGTVPLTQIQEKAFASHSELARVTIPDSVTSIAADAFEGCREDLVIASSADAYARTWAKNNEFVWEHDLHTETIDAAVPATHVTTGLTQGSHCEACGEVITAQEVIPTVEVSTVRLPGMLKVIDQQAFSGNNFECVVLPEGCLRIEALAFENCANLRFIEIPASVTRIDPSAFTGCSEEMIIVTVSGSTAATFAAEHGFTCIIP